MAFEESSELVFEAQRAVVLGLAFDVSDRFFDARRAHAEGTVALLPGECSERRKRLFGLSEAGAALPQTPITIETAGKAAAPPSVPKKLPALGRAVWRHHRSEGDSGERGVEGPSGSGWSQSCFLTVEPSETTRVCLSTERMPQRPGRECCVLLGSPR